MKRFWAFAVWFMLAAHQSHAVSHPFPVLTPQDIDFGAVSVGTTKELDITLKGPGQIFAPTDVVQFRVVGLSAPIAWLQLDRGTCPFTPVASCVFSLTFQPTGVGAFRSSGDLLVETLVQAKGAQSSVDILIALDVSGTGIAPVPLPAGGFLLAVAVLLGAMVGRRRG